MSIDFDLENTGRTPATYVSVHPELVIFGDDGVSAKQEQIIALSAAPSLLALGQGIPLFPGAFATQGISLSIPKEKINGHLERIKAATGNTPTFVSLCLVGCVVYKAPIDNSIHKTAFCLDLTELRAEGSGVQNFAILIGKNAPQANLRLTYFPSGNYAD